MTCHKVAGAQRPRPGLRWFWGAWLEQQTHQRTAREQGRAHRLKRRRLEEAACAGGRRGGVSRYNTVAGNGDLVRYSTVAANSPTSLLPPPWRRSTESPILVLPQALVATTLLLVVRHCRSTLPYNANAGRVAHKQPARPPLPAAHGPLTSTHHLSKRPCEPSVPGGEPPRPAACPMTPPKRLQGAHSAPSGPGQVPGGAAGGLRTQCARGGHLEGTCPPTPPGTSGRPPPGRGACLGAGWVREGHD